MTAVAGISCARTQKSRGRPLGSTARAIREAVLTLPDRYQRMTVRQVFYTLEVDEIVEKSDTGYRQVQKQVLRMRRDGLLPWEFITDGTRWRRRPDAWDSVQDAMSHMAQTYRRDLWRSQRVRIELWLEKDALADVVVDTTSAWGVPLMVSRGQSSATFLWSAAQEARRAWDTGVATYIYALYDRDAAGRRAARTIARELRTHAPGVPILFSLLAVTDEQVEEWSLPSRPAKTKDPEAAKFNGRAVELDAIPPDRLNQIIKDAIVSHIDPHAWRVEQVAEQEERRILERLAGGVA